MVEQRPRPPLATADIHVNGGYDPKPDYEVLYEISGADSQLIDMPWAKVITVSHILLPWTAGKFPVQATLVEQNTGVVNGITRYWGEKGWVTGFFIAIPCVHRWVLQTTLWPYKAHYKCSKCNKEALLDYND